MNLGPNNLNDYVGQDQVKKNLKVIIEASKRGTSIDHMLFSGPPGLGKTSLAEIVAVELCNPIIKLMGPQLRNVGDLNIFYSLRPRTVVFIDEIHSLPLKVEEALYEPMDEFKWKGRVINSFTLIGATTKEGSLSKPLRSRFTIAETLQPYSVGELCSIINRSATIMGITIEDSAIEVLARRSRGTARMANSLLKRVSYYSSVITADSACNALDSIGIDKYGLEMLDRKILTTVKKDFQSGPVGIDSLASVVNEDISTIDSREPYLVNIGFIQRTGKGRVLTKEGADYVQSIENL